MNYQLNFDQEQVLGNVHGELDHGGWAYCTCPLAMALRYGAVVKSRDDLADLELKSVQKGL
jgi:hypothetical protein